MDKYTAAKLLNVNIDGSPEDFKKAYRKQALINHPDKGGDPEKIVKINAAWSILSDAKARKEYDYKSSIEVSVSYDAKAREIRNENASNAVRMAKKISTVEEENLLLWIKTVYNPINRLLTEVINPFAKDLKELSADPYDDYLMESFCKYLKRSQNNLEKVNRLYESMATPNSARGLGLILYHYLSQVNDAISELERYTMGYVDNYLHDGKEMLLEAKQIRIRLKEELRRLQIK